VELGYRPHIIVQYRGNFAGIGFTYDEENDVFYSPQPYPSWILNEELELGSTNSLSRMMVSIMIGMKNN
jgi:hypothetical protein